MYDKYNEKLLETIQNRTADYLLKSILALVVILVMSIAHSHDWMFGAFTVFASCVMWWAGFNVGSGIGFESEVYDRIKDKAEKRGLDK